MNFIFPKNNCQLCSRLKEFRDSNKSINKNWFNKPVPSFGSENAKILIVGLAPGLKGANRTGRPFTGDYAGNILYESLIKNNLAKGYFNKDGFDNLKLNNCRITNSVRCVPPQNKPNSYEIKKCNFFLKNEINNLNKLKIILTLGRIAHISVIQSLNLKNSKYIFKHGKIHRINGYTIINSYHCSQYNIFTKRLTPKEFDKIIKLVKNYL